MMILVLQIMELCIQNDGFVSGTPRQGSVPDWVPPDAKPRFAQLVQTCPGWTGSLNLNDASWMQWIGTCSCCLLSALYIHAGD